jgi:hypothetical protein
LWSIGFFGFLVFPSSSHDGWTFLALFPLSKYSPPRTFDKRMHTIVAKRKRHKQLLVAPFHSSLRPPDVDCEANIQGGLPAQWYRRLN